MAPSCVRLVVLAVLIVALGPSPASAQESAPLRLRPGDAVRLEVRDEPALGGEFNLDESGGVLLPLIGIVRAGGRDFGEVRAEVEAAYERELNQVEVRITPLMRVAVLGEVRAPGLYPVDPTYTLGDVLALAGGLGPEADQDRITLVRAGRVMAEAGADDVAAVSIPLRSGDQVVVARRGWFASNSGALIGGVISIVVAVTTAVILR